MKRRRALTAKIEPFDSFWEAPDDIESGYRSFALYYRDNYWNYFPENREARILCISCGPGYLVKLLGDSGYKNVLGIDSFPEKIQFAKDKNLNCQVAYAFDFLEDCSNESYDVIFCEQELNHLTKDEILDFLSLCEQKLVKGGLYACFALNGANPITGAEALAQNFDHQNTFTEYSLNQVLRHIGFVDVRIINLNLYVFYKNPFNYVAMGIAWLYSAFFRISFILYGKKNKAFAKKIAAVCKRDEK